MIVDLPEPRNVEISSNIRSLNPIKERFKQEIRNIASDIVYSMRGEDDDRDIVRSRSRDRDREDLDDTRSRLSSPLPPNDAEFRVNDRRAQIPQWILILFVLQGGGAIYSWATMRSDINYARQESIRIEAKIDAEIKARTDDIKVIGMQREKDKDDIMKVIRDLVRDEIANQLVNRGVFRIQPSVP